jgi:hypothetical protein
MSLIRDISNSSVKDVLHITEQLLVSGTSTFDSITTQNIKVSAVTELADLVVQNISIIGKTSGANGAIFAGARGPPGETGKDGKDGLTVVNALNLEAPVFTGLTTIGSAIKITQDDPGHIIYKTYASGSVYGMGQYHGGILRLFTSDNSGPNVSIRFSKFTGNSSSYGGNSTTFDDMMIITNNGNVGINKTNPTEKLDVNGNINCLSLKINNTSILHNTSFTGIVTTGNVLQLGENGNDNVAKSLKFGGLFGDNNYEHAVIEHRIYEGTEASELLLFKGNDQNDRIRIKGGEIRFDTWSDDVNNRTSVNTKLMITTSGVMKHTAGNNSYTEYGPNSDLGRLFVGACEDRTLPNNATDAQVIVRSGNLHLDAGHRKGVYINNYNTQSYVNMTGTVTMNGICNIAGTLSCQDLNVNNVSIQNLTSRNNPTFTGNRVTITGDAPTIHLKDSNNKGAFIHCNLNQMYFLSGNIGATQWESSNSYPLVINLNDGSSQFGSNVNINGDCNTSGKVICNDLIIGTMSLRNYILNLVPPSITFQSYMPFTPANGFSSMSTNPCMYRRTSEFEVVFTGEIVRDDNSKYIMWTLPVTHRPKYFGNFLVPTRSINFAGDMMYGTAHITFNRSGTMILNRTNDIIMSLEGIRFISENRQQDTSDAGDSPL